MELKSNSTELRDLTNTLRTLSIMGCIDSYGQIVYGQNKLDSQVWWTVDAITVTDTQESVYVDDRFIICLIQKMNEHISKKFSP